MAQPPAYNREKDFAKDFGNETDHTALNAELDKASNSINDIRANLALIQADDGKIRASSITTDSLAQEVLDYVQATALAGANAVADAATAIAREAQQQAENAVQTATGAVDKSDEAVTTAHAAQEQAQQADAKAEQALGETAQIDGKVSAAVDDALHDAVIPGLTAETIEGALGYVPYDGKTNTLDFATTAEVAGAIAAIPEPVNADWNASKGAAAILNKPALSTVATSGNYADLAGKPVLATVATSGSYNDLQNKPVAMTGATAEAAGTSGFVPAPSAGDENKVLKGDGTWGDLNGKAGIDLTNLSTVGKEKVANLAMPSDRYMDLTIPPTMVDHVFTAPADGYVCLRVEATEVYQNITLLVDQIASANQANSIGYWMSAMIPVRKGKGFSCYWTGGNVKYFRFYYAEGSQPA